MTSRTLLALSAVVALLVLLAVFSQREISTNAGSRAFFLPGLDAQLNDITRLQVVKAAGETATTIERAAEGWVVVEKDRYPADLAKVRQALLALAQARILESKTANAELHDRLGVEAVTADSAVGTELVIEGGSNPVAVIIGNSEGADYRYARLSDDAQSYLIDRDPDLPGSAAEWLDPGILDIDAARVQSVTVSHMDGETVRVSKNDRNQERFSVDALPEGRELLYVGVADAMAGALRNLRLEDVERAPEGQGTPPVTTEFRTFDGLVVTAMGTAAEEPWVTFDVRFDPAQADRFATGAVAAQESGTEVNGGTPQTAAAEAGGAAVAEEALSLARRLNAWRYRIASYQFEQISRRREDLLKAE